MTALDHKQLRRIQADVMLEMARLLTGQDQCVAERLAAVGIDDITPAQSRVLMILIQAREPLTARELARRMGVSEPTMSRFVRALVGAGWVEKTRSDSDRRAWKLTVTPHAREHLPALIRASNAILDRIFSGFSTQDVEALGTLLDRVRQNLD